MLTRILLFFCALFVSAPAFAQVIGVLEDRPGVYAGEPHRRVVRAVFQKLGQHWEARPQQGAPAPPAHWTIAFDGRAVGTVDTHADPQLSMNSDVGLQALASPEQAPKIGAPSAEFQGMLGEPVLRPLIAVSEPNVADPQHWRRAALSAQSAALVRTAFRNHFPHVENCTAADTETTHAWAYADAEIGIEKTYSAADGWSVVQVQLRDAKCDGPPDDAFSEQTFAISPAHEVSLLGDGLRLVDAGDYDNDGKSELVFLIDRYNAGGYELFSDDFRQHATFSFSYH